jgi:hypothetical protein
MGEEQKEESGEVKSKGLDYVALIGVFGLTVMGSVALYFGDSVIAGTAVGGLSGLVFRINR